MEREERIKLILEFSDFINNNFDFVKSMYKLFKDGKSSLNIDNKIVELKAVDFNEEKPDILKLTMTFIYVNMLQLKNPNKENIEVTVDELSEIFLFCDYLEKNNKSFIKLLEN